MWALLFVPLVLSAPVTSESAVAPSAVAPSDGQASAAARQVFDWLAQPPGPAGSPVASGFFGGYSGSTFSLAQTQRLQQQTGQSPGVLACDYGADGSSTIDTSCDATLESWWQSGGLVSVSVHAPNPAQPNLQGLYTHLADFRQITDPTTAVGAAWQRTMDQIAAGLSELNAAGVPVLFRPMHEMNGSGNKAFWWSGQDPAAYATVWRYMYTYLTRTKGLHNLLWVYSPLCNAGDRAGYYPGAGYTDVVALDCYLADPTAAQGYNELVALGKPFAFAEIGPPNNSRSGLPATSSYDYGRWADAIHNRFPATRYFLAWNDGWSPASQRGGQKLLTAPWTVNRGGIQLPPRAGTTAPVRPTRPPGDLLAGFEDGTAQGWTGDQQLDGPWAVIEWSASGSYSLKEDIDLGRPGTSLRHVGKFDLSKYAGLSVVARTAPWGGGQAGGMQAKLYVKTGPNQTWHDGGAAAIGPDGTTLTLPLTGLADLDDVREIGVQFTPAAGASGRSSVYVDDLTAARP